MHGGYADEIDTRDRTRLRKDTLRTRLLALVAVVALPLVLYIGYQILHLYEDLRENEVRVAERNAFLVSVSFDRFIHQMVEQGQSVGLAVLGEGMDAEESRRYLRSLGQHAPISNFTVLDTEGEVVASALEGLSGEGLSSAPAFQRVVEGAPFAVTSVRDNASGERGLAVLAPVGDPLRGVVSVAIDGEDLSAVVPMETPQGVVLLADGNGTLAYTDSSRLERAVGGLSGGLPSDVARANEDGSLKRSIRLPGLEGEYLGAQVPIGATAWTAGFYRPTGEALAHVSSEMRFAVLTVVAILALSAVAAWRVSSRVLVPVERLTSAAQALASGDFGAEVEAEGPGEVGILAERFGEMRDALAHTFASLERLAEAGGRLSAVTTVGEVAEAGLSHLAGLLRTDEAVLTLREQNGETFVHALPGVDAEELAERASSSIPDDTLAGRGHRMRFVDEPSDTHPRGRYLVTLPLEAESALIGRVDLMAVPDTRPVEFERADLEVAAGLARQTAIALLNAQRFELEREIARTLQDSLLTEPIPMRDTALGLTYSPATAGVRVGGDFYDFIRIDDSRVAVVLGDISGHGLSAARHTTAAKGAIRSFALDDPSPASVLTKASAAIGEQLGASGFVTAFYLLMDTDTGETRFANAGHPTPFLLTEQGRVQSMLLPGGPPLGVDPSFAMEEHRTVLRSGDRLVLFSDGLTEARSADGSFFGERGVSEVLESSGHRGAEDIAELLARAAEEHAGGRLSDDLAVVVLQRLAGEREGAI